MATTGSGYLFLGSERGCEKATRLLGSEFGASLSFTRWSSVQAEALPRVTEARELTRNGVAGGSGLLVKEEVAMHGPAWGIFKISASSWDLQYSGPCTVVNRCENWKMPKP